MGDRIESPCQSISPRSNRPCLKDSAHQTEEPIVVHQNGNVTWGSGSEESNTTPAWRCRSISPSRQLACAKADFHNRTELVPTHQNGHVVWEQGMPGEVPAAPRLPFGEQLRKAIGDAFPFPSHGPALFAEDRFGVPFSADFEAKTDIDDLITASPERQLSEWWRQCADDEIARTVPKAVEYGATDLIDIGRNVARLAGREVDDRQAAELGIFFYLEGKFARWRSAIMEGRDVSDDTLFDIGVYVRMTQRIREFGSWPGTTEPVEPRGILNNRTDSSGPIVAKPGFTTTRGITQVSFVGRKPAHENKEEKP